MKISQVEPLQALHQASLQVNTDLDALIQVLEWFDQFYSPFIPPQAWMECKLALAEGFTNAVRHAHRDQPIDLTIDLEVQLFDDRVELRIWDQGPPFDLEAWFKDHPPYDPPILPIEVEDLKEGGRGLWLMKKIADYLSYTRTLDSCNCLLLIKKFLPIRE